MSISSEFQVEIHKITYEDGDGDGERDEENSSRAATLLFGLI